MIICGTGHRPDKLGGYSPEVFEELKTLAHMYLCVATDLEGVISGGALGWDQALAAAALDLNIPTTMALPFPGFEDRWPSKSKTFLHSLIYRASKTVFVCDPGYAGWKMQKRNEWMVDNADSVLALWDGSDGGTGNCVRYANKVGKPITNLWSEWSK
jgi:uncharacterized phage-like protein YoqJ